MSGHSLPSALSACRAFLPAAFLDAHARLFHPAHLARLADRLAALHRAGVPDTYPPPHFAAECTPPAAAAFEPFRRAMDSWAADPARADVAPFADALVAVGTGSLLALLGQRRTPGSLTDERAIPPTGDELLAAAARPVRPGDPLSVAARALDKHVTRPGHPVWGEVRGSAVARTERATVVVTALLNGATWWNVFHHGLHGPVYEARLPSGHGARWAVPAIIFIGFVEPFDEAG
jgi:hypothetical protein